MARIGKLIEKTKSGGEIRKLGSNVPTYLTFDSPTAVAVQHATLMGARAALGVDTSPKKGA